MKKKVLATLLATAMVAATLVGCGNSSNDTTGGMLQLTALRQQTLLLHLTAVMQQTAAQHQIAAVKPLNMVQAQLLSG